MMKYYYVTEISNEIIKLQFNRMKKSFFILVLLAGMTLAANGQDYRTGIGIRGGLYNGLTVKHFITSDVAIEGLLTARWNGYLVTGLYEMHAPAFSTEGLYWYYGFGGHVGAWDADGHSPYWDDDESHVLIGVDGIVGIEYNIGQIPFNISLDFKPALNLIGHTGLSADQFALSVRYVFGNR
jgi:hypothetical protein